MHATCHHQPNPKLTSSPASKQSHKENRSTGHTLSSGPSFSFWKGRIAARLLFNCNHPLSSTTPNNFNPVHQVMRPTSTMNPVFDPLHPRGWRNPQFHHATGPPFQFSHQTTYHNVIPPPPMPPAASLPVTYYDTNGSYYHASQYSEVHSPWYGNMDHYVPDSQQLQPGYYDTQFSVPPVQNNGCYLQDRSDTSRCALQSLLLVA